MINCGGEATSLALRYQTFGQQFVRTGVPATASAIRKPEHACARHSGCQAFTTSGASVKRIAVIIHFNGSKSMLLENKCVESIVCTTY